MEMETDMETEMETDMEMVMETDMEKEMDMETEWKRTWKRKRKLYLIRRNSPYSAATRGMYSKWKLTCYTPNLVWGGAEMEKIAVAE